MVFISWRLLSNRNLQSKIFVVGIIFAFLSENCVSNLIFAHLIRLRRFSTTLKNEFHSSDFIKAISCSSSTLDISLDFRIHCDCESLIGEWFRNHTITFFYCLLRRCCCCSMKMLIANCLFNACFFYQRMMYVSLKLTFACNLPFPYIIFKSSERHRKKSEKLFCPEWIEPKRNEMRMN